MTETLHLTQKELTSVKETLYEFLTLMLQEINCEFIVDCPIQKFLLQVDCAKKEAMCYLGEQSFAINKHARVAGLTGNTDEAEFLLYKLFKQTGIDDLKRTFQQKVAARQKIHDEIEGSVSSAPASTQETIPDASPLQPVLSKQEEFTNLFDELIEKIGFRAKSTEVSLNATGQLLISKTPEKYLITVEEKIHDFDGNVFIHKFEYNTITKHPCYTYNGQEKAIEDMIGSTSCSVDFKRANDIILTILDKKIRGTDVLKEETPQPTDHFENFKKSHVE